jgi:hypothetical protein
MYRPKQGARFFAACALAAACAAVSTGSTARAESGPACPSSTDNPYRMSLRALTGPAGADLRVSLASDVAACAVPATLKKVQLKVSAADGTVASTRNLTDVAAPNGVATLDLGQVPRQRHVDADVLVQTDNRTHVLRGDATTLLRPDLVASVDAPKQVLVGKPFSVTVVVAERNKDVGASATVSLPAYPTATKRIDVAAGGTATVVFDGVALTNHGHGLALAAVIGDAAPAETDTTNNTLNATIDVLRPPDLVVRSIAPQQALVGSPFTVSVVVAEANGDLQANASVTMSAVPGATQPVSVPAGGTATVTFPGVKFDTAVRVAVTATVVGAAPDESDTTNNTLTSPIDITKSAVNLPTVLFPSLGGYGTQFGDHVYAPITPWPAGVGYAGFEDKVKALEPQLVRIFYNDNWDANASTGPWSSTVPQNYASFVHTVQLAQEAGATIDITFQNLGNEVTTQKVPVPLYTPEQAMSKFADVFVDLVVNHGLTNVRWAEVANEPNNAGGAATLQLYADLVHALDAQLKARGLHDQVHIMGGGLIESSGDKNHYAWLSWIAQNLGDVVDAYAEHIYWTYDHPGRLEYRLRDTYNLATQALAPELQKPMYQMEFGVRGYNSCTGKPTLPQANQDYYRDANCTDIWRTNIAAFQQLWFEVAAAQLGVAGTSKWDAYWSRYDTSSVNNQFFWTIGPPSEGSPLTPTYYALSLLFHVTAPGWKIIRVDPWDASDYGVPATNVSGGETSNDTPEQELVAYSGPNGELTVVGLDTNGRSLNGASSDPPSSYSIGGLPPNTTFNLTLWNATGDGTNSIAPSVTTNAAGVARFDVPLQAAFALTTVPVS